LVAGLGERLRILVANWDQPMPLHRKLRLAARNTATKIVRRQNCCGHDEEPGC
jgi:hypothetical protein